MIIIFMFGFTACSVGTDNAKTVNEKSSTETEVQEIDENSNEK